MPKKSKKSPRAAGVTQISISLSQGLITLVDKMANAEKRNRSNFISNEMSKLAAARLK